MTVPLHIICRLACGMAVAIGLSLAPGTAAAEGQDVGSPGKWSWQAACDPSGNQMALNACANVAQIEAEEELEAVREETAELFEDDPELKAEMLARLDEMQRTWRIQLQNDLEALFPMSPGDDPTILYGSSYPMEYAYATAFLVRQRAEFLRAYWLGQGG